MNYIKGFRFHPTDAEAIELLWDKIVHDRDSTVQVGDSLIEVITQLKDICEFGPRELPGLSKLESGDNLWYFFCSPKYKYRRSKRKNRVTKEGYWYPTGKPRRIVTTYDGNEITGIRQTLVFYRGRVSDKNKKENRTPWVIHEFELELNLPNQKNITLCKLKKKHGKLDVSRGEEGQSSHSLPSNIENHGTNNGIPIPKDQLKSDEPLTESEAFNEHSGIQTQSITNEQDDDEFVDSLLVDNDENNSQQSSNKTYFVDEYGGPKPPSNFQADGDIPKNQEDFGELMNQRPKATNDYVVTLNQATINENDNSSRSSIFIADDHIYSKGGGSEPGTLFTENEGSSLAFGHHVAEGSFPMEHSEFDEFLRNGLFMTELLPVPEAPTNPDGVEHDQFSTDEQDDEFWSSIFFTTDEVGAYPEVFSSKQQNLAAKTDEGSNFSSISTTQSTYDPRPMGPSRKRPRIESEGFKQ